jgi:hypothetical protein
MMMARETGRRPRRPVYIAVGSRIEGNSNRQDLTAGIGQEAERERDACKTASSMGLFQVSVEKMLFVVGRVHLALVGARVGSVPTSSETSSGEMLR